MGRFRDALQTLLQPSWDAKLRRDHAEVRMMVTELNDALEKLNMWLARMAKRSQRETRRVLEQETADPPERPLAAPLRPPTRAEWKAAMWEQIRGRRAIGGPLPPSEEEPTE